MCVPHPTGVITRPVFGAMLDVLQEAAVATRSSNSDATTGALELSTSLRPGSSTGTDPLCGSAQQAEHARAVDGILA